ncbi:MAG: ribonuclease P protein subunit [Candidatus Hermodarchaeota archaeon]
MQFKEQQIIHTNLIGCSCRVIYLGKSFTGIIILESRNMIILKDQNGKIKKFPKAQSHLIIDLHNRKINLLGKEIMGRAEERIIKRVRRRW